MSVLRREIDRGVGHDRAVMGRGQLDQFNFSETRRAQLSWCSSGTRALWAGPGNS